MTDKEPLRSNPEFYRRVAYYLENDYSEIEAVEKVEDEMIEEQRYKDTGDDYTFPDTINKETKEETFPLYTIKIEKKIKWIPKGPGEERKDLMIIVTIDNHLGKHYTMFNVDSSEFDNLEPCESNRKLREKFYKRLIEETYI